MKHSAKILVVIETLGVGGAEKLLCYLLPALVKLGVDCRVAVLFPPYDLAQELERVGIHVHRLNLRRRWFLLEAIAKISRICKEEKIEVLWGHLYLATLNCRLLKVVWRGSIGVVSSLHGMAYGSQPICTYWQKIRRKLDAVSGARCDDRTIAVSQAVANDYHTHLNWEHVKVIYNAVPTINTGELTGEDRIAERRRYGIGANDFLVVLPARHVEIKGHRYLIEALQIARERSGVRICLVAPGGGALTDHLVQYAEQLLVDDQVQMVDSLPQSALYRLVAAADSVVMPSLSEGLSITAVEAMSMAKPVVLTAVGGNVELIEDRVCGLLVPPRDCEALAQAICDLRNDPAWAREMGLAARKRLGTSFNMGVIGLQWANELKNVAAEYASKPANVLDE